MTFILEIFIFMISFWIVSEFIEGIRIKGMKSLLVASFVYFISLIICKIVFGVLIAIFTLGLLPFFWFFNYAISAFVAFSIAVSIVQESEISAGAMAWGVIVVTVASSVLRFLFL